MINETSTIIFNTTQFIKFDSMTDIEIIKNYCNYINIEIGNILLLMLILYILIEIFSIFLKENIKPYKDTFYITIFIFLLVLNSYTLPYFDFATERFFQTIKYIMYIIICILGYIVYKHPKFQKWINEIIRTKDL